MSVQAVHSFLLKLLKTELHSAKEYSGKAAEDMRQVKSKVKRTFDERLWPTVIKKTWSSKG